jgi:glycosyltransferase involved in cell wall biosynthesis
MTRKPRILFVCFPDSTHAQSWIGMLKGSDFNVRIFSIPLRTKLDYRPEWLFSTYIVHQPEARGKAAPKIYWLFPNIKGLKTFFSWLEDRFSLSILYLRFVIVIWKPEIVHSFSFDSGSKLTRRTLQNLHKKHWPKWVVSAWGSDFYIGIKDPDRRENIKYILSHCNGFFADCQRDLEIAVREGLDPKKVIFENAIPGSGGIDTEYFKKFRKSSEKRNLIVVPKAFSTGYGVTGASSGTGITILEALRMIEEDLDEFRIHLVNCSKSVRLWLQTMPDSLRNRCYCHGMVPQDELFRLFSHARVMVSPSLSDGTPNVMLEAMAAGALPIMSPIDSVYEWIEDGENGLLAHALYPDQIALAIRRGLTDDALFERAREKNWEIIRNRANRSKIKEQVCSYYQSLAG